MFRRIVALSSLVAFTQACSSDKSEPGSDGGVEGTGCTVGEKVDGQATIECPDGTSVTIADGEWGASGEDGGKGDPGEKGQDGDAGKDGDPGRSGGPGVDGVPGANGNPGENGDPGQDGQDGTTGTPGEVGDPGKACSVECADEQTVRIFCQGGTEVTYAVRSCGDPPPGWLSVGSDHACGVRPTDGRLVCWGSDSSQKLGNGAFAVDQVSASFVDTRTLPDGMDTTWQIISSAWDHTCGLTTAGDAHCWGAVNISTNSGDTSRPTPLDMSALPAGTTWTMLTSGINGGTTCGITTAGAGYCWGQDGSGQRGDGAISGAQPGPSPIDTSALPPDTSWSVLSAGRLHTCGLTADGTAYCWGRDENERLGNGRFINGIQYSPSAVEVAYLPEGTTWSTISAGDSHTCAVTTAGEAYCWGSDAWGQLGRDGVVGPSDYPRPVDSSELLPGTSWARISAGSEHTCGVATDGAAYCWGNAASGRLGNGSSAGTRLRPGAIDLGALPAGTTWVEVDAGDAFTCGLTSKAEAYCWGNDDRGQLGNGSVSGNQLVPEHLVRATFGIYPDPLVDPNLVFYGMQNSTKVTGAVGDPTNPSLLMTLLPMETPLEELVLTATSSNESVLPSTNITFSGVGTERTASLDPAAPGISTVTFTVSNGSGEQISFPVEYAASAQPPHSSGRYHSHISDASAAVDVGDGYMLLANDETNRLFLHSQNQAPRSRCGTSLMTAPSCETPKPISKARRAWAIRCFGSPRTAMAETGTRRSTGEFCLPPPSRAAVPTPSLPFRDATAVDPAPRPKWPRQGYGQSSLPGTEPTVTAWAQIISPSSRRVRTGSCRTLPAASTSRASNSRRTARPATLASEPQQLI